MAALSANALTLIDWAKRLDPNGKIPIIAELLSQSNEILDDALFVEGNLPTGDKQVIRTGLPTAYWRAINEGVPSSKSTTAEITEACGMLESRAQVDKDLAELNGNSKSFLLSEHTAFMEAMNQTMTNTVFYGDVGTTPKAFTGLQTRYSAISGADNGANVLSAGGSGADNTSIYLVGWGKETAYMHFPKGSKAGLQVEELGIQDVLDASGNVFRAHTSHYQWKTGLMVKDWRYVVRICNIDVSDLQAAATTQALTAATNILKLMNNALSRFPNLSMCKPAFYMNRTVHTSLSNMAMDKSSSALSIKEAKDQFGQISRWTEFGGVPLRRVDRLGIAEAVVS
jgi:hypothetical protein